jgi:hypothetical protein
VPQACSHPARASASPKRHAHTVLGPAPENIRNTTSSLRATRDSRFCRSGTSASTAAPVATSMRHTEEGSLEIDGVDRTKSAVPAGLNTITGAAVPGSP